MGTYIDDERQSLQPLGPRQQGGPQTPHLRHRSGSMGLRTRFSPLAPCSWGVCDQSILIFGCDRTLADFAGRGQIIWLPRKRGRPLPVLSDLASIWNMPNNKYAGSAKYVANLLNHGAAGPVKQPQDRFTWVVVHAWSHFKLARDNSKDLSLFDAARACAAALSPKIKVVSLWQLARASLAAQH